MLEINERNNIKLTRGDTAILSVSLKDANGINYEVQNGDKLKLTLKESYEDSKAIFTKENTALFNSYNDWKSYTNSSYSTTNTYDAKIYLGIFPSRCIYNFSSIPNLGTENFEFLVKNDKGNILSGYVASTNYENGTYSGSIDLTDCNDDEVYIYLYYTSEDTHLNYSLTQITARINASMLVTQYTTLDSFLTFTITSEESESLEYGNYKYDIQLTTMQGNVFTPISYKNFRICEEVG